jgi:hypothetical protein
VSCRGSTRTFENEKQNKTKKEYVALASEYCQSNATYPTVLLIKNSTKLSIGSVGNKVRATRAVCHKNDNT